jgi:thiamine-phosphate pyrophosphorylase
MICLVTDRRRLVMASGKDPTTASNEAVDRLVELVAAAACAGVDLVQIRERDLQARELTALVRQCAEAIRSTKTRLVVNDRTDVAIAGGAHGVHLRSDSVEAAAVRSLLPSGATVGRSVHTAEEAAAVSHAGGVDYLVFGTVFQTMSKDPAHRLTTLDELGAACRVSSVPVLAIGGMTAERASLVARAGASGIAGIGLFIPPAGESPREHLTWVVRELRRWFDTCGAVP